MVDFVYIVEKTFLRMDLVSQPKIHKHLTQLHGEVKTHKAD